MTGGGAGGPWSVGRVGRVDFSSPQAVSHGSVMGSDRSLRPLILLDEGFNYYGVVVKIGLLRLVYRFGGGEGVSGGLGGDDQVLMNPGVLVPGQVRGVAHRRSLGVVDVGPQVRGRDLAHLELLVRGHLRP